MALRHLTTLILILGTSAALAVPKVLQVPLFIDVAETPCSNIDTFTTEWFLENTLPQYRSCTARLKNALFYSQGMSAQAQEYARSEGMTTIWDIWPCGLYDYRDRPENPMRCIFNDKATTIRYFENMSRAFAQKAAGISTVLHSAQNFASPPQNGIWNRVEYPTLTKSGHVELLTKVKECPKTCEVFWKNPARLGDESLRCPDRTRTKRQAPPLNGTPRPFSDACATKLDMTVIDDIW